MQPIIDVGEILLRSVSSIVILFILTKLMGYKQISQLTFFDYAVGITIGSIAAQMAFDKDTPFYFMVIAMAVYAGVSILISFITNKSIKARRVLTGTPIMLIENGKIIKKNLNSAHFDLNDLLSECRIGGYFNISDIQYAIMETNGKVSFLVKSDKRPLEPYDINLRPPQEGLCANVIIDGQVMQENLKMIGKNEEWLQKQLKEQKVNDVSQVLLGTCDRDNQLTLFFEKEKGTKHTELE